ncbi:hypothetical protein PRNP1_007346 [Phytophthora ramorum]
MTNAKRVDPRKEVKPESARPTISQATDSQAPKDSAVTSSRASKAPKKKPHQNSAEKSTTSKGGDSKPHKKRKKKNQKNHKVGDSEREIELHTDAQSKTPQQKVQVRQRSFSTLLVTGSSQVAVGDTATGVEPGNPAVDDTGGFAKGDYGILLETKRTENLCLSLGLQKRHLESMLRAFKHEDQLGTKEITTGEFFSMLREQSRQLTKGLFEAAGLARDLRRMRFDDFVICVATIATWSKSELLHYAFKQFDVDESGVMDGSELRAFCEGLKNDSSFYFSKNVNTAREKLAARDRNPYRYRETTGPLEVAPDAEANTLVDLEDLAKGSSEFQVAFYPLLQLQQNVRACALGERFWAEVAQRRHDIECIVHYMRLHKGKLPSISILNRIIAYLLPFSRANATLAVHKLAILKFAEEQRILQDQAHTRAEANGLLAGVQEEDQTP